MNQNDPTSCPLPDVSKSYERLEDRDEDLKSETDSSDKPPLHHLYISSMTVVPYKESQ